MPGARTPDAPTDSRTKSVVDGRTGYILPVSTANRLLRQSGTNLSHPNGERVRPTMSRSHEPSDVPAGKARGTADRTFRALGAVGWATRGLVYALLAAI